MYASVDKNTRYIITFRFHQVLHILPKLCVIVYHAYISSDGIDSFKFDFDLYSW